MSKPYMGPSDSQANADALDRRSRTYADPSDASFRIQWQWTRRQPRSLRDAADMIRRAYAEEVPSRLHNRDLADDGTPKMTPQAESYIFEGPYEGEAPRGCDPMCRRQRRDEPGSPHLTDCPTLLPRPALDYYRTPFRAALARLEGHSAERAGLVRHVATGQSSPVEAARSAGIPGWAAKIVAEDVIFAFMRSLSDLKISLPAEGAA